MLLILSFSAYGEEKVRKIIVHSLDKDINLNILDNSYDKRSDAETSKRKTDG
jgi:hypothetical protein